MKHETHFTEQLEKQTQSGNDISNFLSKYYMKSIAWKVVRGPFYFSWNPLQNEIAGGQSAGLDKFKQFY